jgi:exonuclease SbcD
VKLLHTSDWHLGKKLRGRSREDEFEAALSEILDIAKEEAVEVVLVTGDIFDSIAPSAEAERLFYRGFLTELHGYGIKAILLCGNHDHPARLEAVEKLLALLDVTLVTAPKVVELTCRNGDEAAIIACLPWVRQHQALKIEDLSDELSAQCAYSERVGKIIQRLAQHFRKDAVNILAGHLMIKGATIGGGERLLDIGDTYALESELLPEAAQYVALGHIHRPQEIAATAPTRYAGSILQLDFGEVDQQKSVVLVQANPMRPATVNVVPLKSGRALRDVAAPLSELSSLGNYANEHAFFRVEVSTDGPVPNLAERVREVLPNAIQVTAKYARPEATSNVVNPADLGPEALLAEYYRQQYGVKPPAELMALFRKLYEEVSSEAT